MDMSLGEKLKQLRTLKGVTLRVVEEKTGISNGYLNQLETGKVKEPSPNKLHALAKFYDYSYSSLLKIAGYMVPSEKKATGLAFKKWANLTHEEEEELLSHLEYIRFKKKGKG